MLCLFFVFFFQAEDGIRDAQESRGLGDVYKRQGVTIGAVAEAVTLCEKTGVDANKFIKALSGGFADGKILQNHGKRMIRKDFSPKGKVSTHLKDMNNILECANDFDTQLPISNLIQSMFKSLVDNGNSNDDHSALYKEIEMINKSK